MAFDKVVDSSKLNAAMTATADKIRAKAQTSNPIEWDESNGFADSINTQTKTATPSTNLQAIRPDAGYVGLSQVNVEAIQPITQATPSITVSSAGLITASATQTAGYVAEGTKSATKQLPTQAAKTVTPTTSNQTAVASGKYTTGAITVKGDANLKAVNILQGVSIFGVAGSLETGSKVASGTFTMNASSDNLKNYPISVSGLGFTPTRVMAILESGASINAYDAVLAIDGNGTKTYVVYAEDAGYACDSCETSIVNIQSKSNTVVSLTMFSGGFRISATAWPIGMPAGGTFRYIAIG